MFFILYFIRLYTYKRVIIIYGMNNKFLITILSANSTINHNKKNNNKAFSLIELSLSIVLIIMGLLVAGVTGGAF